MENKDYKGMLKYIVEDFYDRLIEDDADGEWENQTQKNISFVEMTMESAELLMEIDKLYDYKERIES